MIGNDELYKRTQKAMAVLQAGASGKSTKEASKAGSQLLTSISADITEAISPINAPLMPFVIVSMRSVLKVLEERFPEDARLAGCLEKRMNTVSCIVKKKGDQ
jgi:hypothetical protein